jgi:hypothetical protein
MRETISWFMLIATLIVGFYFLITVPTSSEQVLLLETRVAQLQGTNDRLQGRITPEGITPSPTVDEGAEATAITIPTATQPFASPTPIVRQPTSGPRVVSVQATTTTDENTGCATAPGTQFQVFDTIYGVAQLADMEVGTVLTVEFNGPAGVIYTETFTIEEGGTYCRWYRIVPDETGWPVGDYAISYTVNSNPPVTLDYTIN